MTILKIKPIAKEANLIENHLSQENLLNKEFDEQKNFQIKNRQFYSVRKEKNKETDEYEDKPELIANCIFRSIYNINNGTNDSLRLFYLKKPNGDEYFPKIKSSELKKSPFQTVLNSHGCIYRGTEPQLFGLFSILMENETNAVEIATIGYHKDFDVYVLADSVIDSGNEVVYANEFGVIKLAEGNIYLPVASKLNLNARELIHTTNLNMNLAD